MICLSYEDARTLGSRFAEPDGHLHTSGKNDRKSVFYVGR